jgi:hypothetical protein
MHIFQQVMFVFFLSLKPEKYYGILCTVQGTLDSEPEIHSQRNAKPTTETCIFVKLGAYPRVVVPEVSIDK